MRKLSGGGVVAAHGHRSLALQSLRRPPHQWGRVADVARRVLLQTSSLQGVFCVDFCPVVTNVVNLRAFSLIMVVFGLGLTTFVTEALARRLKLRWFDDVCNVGRPFVARPGPAAAHGHRSLALQSLRRPPHRWRLVCWRVVWCVVSTPGRVPRLDVFPLLSFACNSPATLSNREFTTLELQRFQTLLKLHPIELHAKFGGGGVVAAQGSQPGPAAQGVAARRCRPGGPVV